MSTISQNSNNDTVRTISEGRYRLPTVLIQYADGTSQDLLIEVGPPIDSLSVPSIFPNTNSNSNSSNDTNTTSTPNTETTPTINTTSTANPESVGNNNNTTNSNDSTINQQQTEIPGVATPATAAPSSSTPYRRRVLSESAASSSATNPERRD
ncbi:unnamed protein product [[Candida] boidinii]|nr:unnamed protein product [[Candida] boidinii]